MIKAHTHYSCAAAIVLHFAETSLFISLHYVTKYTSYMPGVDCPIITQLIFHYIMGIAFIAAYLVRSNLVHPLRSVCQTFLIGPI